MDSISCNLLCVCVGIRHFVSVSDIEFNLYKCIKLLRLDVVMLALPQGLHD